MSGEPLDDALLAKVHRGLSVVNSGTGTVLLVGDSMLARFQDYGTGRGLLETSKYHNVAIGGATTGHWIWLLQNDLLNSIKFARYQQIFLMLGTNDLSRPERQASDVISGLKDVIALLRARMPNAHVTFVPIFPRTDLADNQTVEDETAIINAAVPTHCDSVVSPVISDPEYFDNDNLHLNRKGYELFCHIIRVHTIAQ